MGKNRTWMYAALALGGGFLGGLAALQLAPAAAEAAHGVRSISTHELVLVDHEGTQRARLSVSTSGMADLEMMDGEGRDRAELRVSENGVSTLGFYDSDGARRVLIGAAPGKRSGITVYGSRDQILAGLTVNDNNESSLTLYDPNTGRARVGLGVATDGAPALAMFDTAGKDRAELHVKSDGEPGLALADANGKTIAGLPVKTASVQQPSD